MVTFAILDLIGDIVYSYIEEFNDLRELVNYLGPLGVFLIIIFFIAIIIFYVFSSLGLMELAKKNNVSNPWLSFIPIGRHYLLGKLGYEVYEKNGIENKQIAYIMLALSAATVIKIFDGPASLALVVLSWLCYNKIYQYLIPEKATTYTFLSFFFNGIPLYFNPSIIKPYEEEVIVTENKEETTNQETNEKKETTTKPTPNFCSSCGTKLNKKANFCPECGKKIN